MNPMHKAMLIGALVLAAVLALLQLVGCAPDEHTPGCRGTLVAADGKADDRAVVPSSKHLAPGTYELSIAPELGSVHALDVAVTCRAGYDDLAATDAIAEPVDATHLLVTTIAHNGAPADQAFYLLLCGVES
jgi:hypothetical protein